MYLSTNQPPWFAFLVHPRDLPDFLTMPGGSLIRRYSRSDEEFVEKAMSNPAAVCDDVAFGGSPVRGEIIGVPRLPEALLTPGGNRAVVEAASMAAGRGVRVIGLGALTAPATAGGKALVRHVPEHVTITNGNGLTAAVAHRNVLEASSWLGCERDARVAVLGATGSVGCALSHLLADDGFELVLIGPTQERVERLLGGLLDRAVAAAGPAATLGASIVVALTNDPSAKLTPEAISPGAVVIDVAQPHNVEDRSLPGFAARNVAVVRGGAVRIPGYSCSRDFGLKSRQETFACLAETYLLAREGIRESSVGRPSADYARRIAAVADRHGVVPCPLELPARQPLSGAQSSSGARGTSGGRRASAVQEMPGAREPSAVQEMSDTQEPSAVQEIPDTQEPSAVQEIPDAQEPSGGDAVPVPAPSDLDSHTSVPTGGVYA